MTTMIGTVALTDSARIIVMWIGRCVDASNGMMSAMTYALEVGRYDSCASMYLSVICG